MRITVTNASQSLPDMLNPEQEAQAAQNRNTKIPYSIFIQNLDSSIDIYIEFGFDATVGDGVRIAANGGTFSIEAELVLDDIRLIANAAENDNVRVAIN